MNAERFHRRWAKRGEELLGEAFKWIERSRNRGDVEDIHLLRVTLRRLRLVLLLGTPILPRRMVREMRDWAARVSDRAGEVRDLDMALEHVPLTPHTKELRRAISRKRRRLWKAGRPWYRLPARKVIRGLNLAPNRPKRRAQLAEHFSVQAARHYAEVMADAPRFFDLDPLDQHAFRRALRRLRYLREIELPAKHWAQDTGLKQLVRLQGAIGELQNRLIAHSILDAFPGDPATVPAQDRLREECREWQNAIRSGLRPFLPGARSPFVLCQVGDDDKEAAD